MSHGGTNCQPEVRFRISTTVELWMLRGLPSLACPIASPLSSSSGQLSNEIFNPPPQTSLGINAFEFWLFALRDLRSLHTLSPQIPAARHAHSTSSMHLTPSSNRRRHHNTTPPLFSVRMYSGNGNL
jgi:hypothetical protein